MDSNTLQTPEPLSPPPPSANKRIEASSNLAHASFTSQQLTASQETGEKIHNGSHTSKLHDRLATLRKRPSTEYVKRADVVPHPSRIGSAFMQPTYSQRALFLLNPNRQLEQSESLPNVPRTSSEDSGLFSSDDGMDGLFKSRSAPHFSCQHTNVTALTPPHFSPPHLQNPSRLLRRAVDARSAREDPAASLAHRLHVEHTSHRPQRARRPDASDVVGACSVGVGGGGLDVTKKMFCPSARNVPTYSMKKAKTSQTIEDIPPIPQHESQYIQLDNTHSKRERGAPQQPPLDQPQLDAIRLSANPNRQSFPQMGRSQMSSSHGHSHHSQQQTDLQGLLLHRAGSTEWLKRIEGTDCSAKELKDGASRDPHNGAAAADCEHFRRSWRSKHAALKMCASSVRPDQDTQKEVGQHPLTARVDTSSQIRVNCTMETLVVTNEALTRAMLITGCKDDTTDNGRFSCGYRRSAYVPLEYGIPKFVYLPSSMTITGADTATIPRIDFNSLFVDTKHVCGSFVNKMSDQPISKQVDIQRPEPMKTKLFPQVPA
ncbi:hypothetical protein BLNAU_20711 [Blattamonas nauphoetae]|uniref:Uncharacterized protein n=1 Tax=Blattamonas nauphoetae TaxID=2049346 RepID=A0ABQ9X170_9EUKA|nr:hypothetical protein BLNAU_20711 [Blattamonas nauphoetae]